MGNYSNHYLPLKQRIYKPPEYFLFTMDHDTNIIRRNTIGKLNSYGKFIECKLCKMEIIGSNQLKLHLAGKRRNRNKVKHCGNTNISICNSESEGE